MGRLFFLHFLNDEFRVVRFLRSVSVINGFLGRKRWNVLLRLFLLLWRVQVEDDLFGLGIVKDTTFVGAFFCMFVVAASHIDGHGNLLQIVQRIENFTDDDDRLHAEITQESDGYQSQQGRQSGHSYQSLNLLTDGQTVVTARIVAGILKERFQELRHRDAGPDEDDAQTHKPLQQLDLVDAHHADRQQYDEDGYQEGCQSEAAFDEEPRNIRS